MTEIHDSSKPRMINVWRRSISTPPAVNKEEFKIGCADDDDDDDSKEKYEPSLTEKIINTLLCRYCNVSALILRLVHPRFISSFIEKFI